MLSVVVLGSAAGGGFPQWNCRCRVCETARAHPDRAHPRTQSTLAVSADGVRWLLLNASPDAPAQLSRLPLPASASGVRVRPFEAVALTDAELDHTLGLPALRQGGRLQVYCTLAVRDVLAAGSGLLALVRPFADVGVHLLSLDTPVEPAGLGLTLEPFAVPGHAPRFAGARHGPGHVVGLIVRDEPGSVSLAFVPSCGAADAVVRERLRSMTAIFFDGTFWSDDEMAVVGDARSARAMGHVPISGADGSLAMLRSLDARHRAYTHINNTNPVLIEDSPERRAVEEAGVQVAWDGMRLELE